MRPSDLDLWEVATVYIKSERNVPDRPVAHYSDKFCAVLTHFFGWFSAENHK